MGAEEFARLQTEAAQMGAGLLEAAAHHAGVSAGVEAPFGKPKISFLGIITIKILCFLLNSDEGPGIMNPMDKRIRFYVSRKNPLTWLMALCMIASAVVRIVLACVRGTGGQRICLGPGGPPCSGVRAFCAHLPPERPGALL